MHTHSGSFALGARGGHCVHIRMVAAYPDGRMVKNFSDLEDEEEARAALSTSMWARDWNEGPMMAQTWFIYKNLDKFLRELGGSLDDIVLQHVYMKDIKIHWLAHERARSYFFKDRPSAVSSVEITDLVPPEALVEMRYMHICLGWKKSKLTLSLKSKDHTKPLLWNQNIWYFKFITERNGETPCVWYMGFPHLNNIRS